MAVVIDHPGPNNVMLTASGVAFIAAPCPHLLGVSLGHSAQIGPVLPGPGRCLCAGLAHAPTAGLGWQARICCGWPGACWAQAARVRRPERPQSFGKAAGFRWINPRPG